MTRNFTISGLKHMLAMLNQYPQLMGLGSFAGVREVGRKAKIAVDRSGCACSAGPIYASNLHIFEQALNQLGNGDHIVVKAILKVDQICYYGRDNTGKQTLKCI